MTPAPPPPPPPLPSITYVPDFLSEQDADQLRRDVQSSKGWVELRGRRLLNLGGLVTKSGLVPAPLPKWLVPLMDRTRDRVGGFGVGGGGDGGRASGAPLPPPPPNHALVNMYHPGEGILPHQDGPAYVPKVAIVSIGSPAVLRFWRRRRRGGGGEGEGEGGSGSDGAPVPGVDRPDASVLLEPRSLVVFEGEAYTDCYHGIEACEQEAIDTSVINRAAAAAAAAAAAVTTTPPTVARCGDRISFTIRRIAKESKVFATRRGCC
jgi:alkylated DNA repair protein alkB homolog 6